MGGVRQCVCIIDAVGFHENLPDHGRTLSEVFRASVAKCVKHLDRVLVICDGNASDVDFHWVEEILRSLSFSEFPSNFTFVHFSQDITAGERLYSESSHLCDRLSGQPTAVVEHRKSSH